MNYLKRFNESNESDIAKICEEFGIRNWSMVDGLVDVDGYVDFIKKGLRKLPLKFGSVSGSFYCYGNKLTTLEGAPKNVGGRFSCQDNNLTSLEGAPVEVGNSFFCSNNNLATLYGAPGSVGDRFDCSYNNLLTLKGAPRSVRGDFYCHYNNLTSLEGAPSSVGGNFYCENNPIYGMWELFRDFKKIEFFNDLDIVRDPIDGQPSFVLDRLNFFLETIGKRTVEKVDGWINI